MKRITIEDANLLSLAKQVFGDELVVNAFVSSVYHDGSLICSGEECGKELNRQLCRDTELDDNSFQFETGETIIEFSNGRKVLFNVSEWLVITKFN